VTYTFESMSTGLVESTQNLHKDPNWGFMSVTLVESTKMIVNRYSYGGLSTVLSAVGGLAASVYSIIFFLLEGYQ